MIDVTIHRLTQIYTDWVKNTEDTENPQKTLKFFSLRSLRLCFLCAFAFILGGLGVILATLAT